MQYQESSTCNSRSHQHATAGAINMQQLNSDTNRSHGRARAMQQKQQCLLAAAAIQTRGPCEQQQLCNSRINATAGSMQQQELWTQQTYNKSSHANSSSCSAAGAMQESCWQPPTSNKHASAVSIHQGLRHRVKVCLSLPGQLGQVMHCHPMSTRQ
jgi:hypothetical protein